MHITTRLLQLVVFLLIFVIGDYALAGNTPRGPTNTYVGSKRYASFVDAACHDRIAATCVRQASRMRYAPGLVNGRTRREIAVRQCLADFNRRQPALLRAEAARTLVDLFRTDPNQATEQDTRACKIAIVNARNETYAILAERDRLFYAQRAARERERNATASATPPAANPTPSDGPTILTQHQTPPLELPDPAPPVRPTVKAWDDVLGPNLVLRSAGEEKAVIYARRGGQFYTVRSSWLRKRYNVDWKTVYSHPGNQNKDFVGACFIGRRVELDTARMTVKSYDEVALNGQTNSSFVADCEKRGGEFRFALQGGQTFEIPALAITPARSAVAPEKRDEPAATNEVAEAVPPAEPVAAPSVSATADVPALSFAPPAIASVAAPVASSAPPAENDQADASLDVSEAYDASVPWNPSSEQDAAAPIVLNQGQGNRGPPAQSLGDWFAGWPAMLLVALALALLVYLIYDMRRTTLGKNVLRWCSLWRVQAGLWFDRQLGIGQVLSATTPDMTTVVTRRTKIDRWLMHFPWVHKRFSEFVAKRAAKYGPLPPASLPPGNASGATGGST